MRAAALALAECRARRRGGRSAPRRREAESTPSLRGDIGRVVFGPAPSLLGVNSPLCVRPGARFPFGSESTSQRVKNGMESAEKALTIRSRGLLTARSRERGTSGSRLVKNAAFFFSPAPYQRFATSPNALSPRGHGKIRATDFDAGFQHPASGAPRAHATRKGLAEQALGRRPRTRPLTTGSRWLFLPSPLGRVLGPFLPRRDPEMALGRPGRAHVVLCVPEPEKGRLRAAAANKPLPQPLVRSDAAFTACVRISPRDNYGSPKQRLHKPNSAERPEPGAAVSEYVPDDTESTSERARVFWARRPGAPSDPLWKRH
jgi:hypothetical protein